MVKRLNIVYFGPISGTCLDRANALRRLGHQVRHLDLRTMLPPISWLDKVTWHLGGGLLTPLLMHSLRKSLKGHQYDLCWVDGGELVTPKLIKLLRQHAEKIVNYSIDDPLGPRDGARNRVYRQSVPYYDLCVVMREKNVDEAKALGAKKVMRVFMTADEITHAPRDLSEEDYKKWSSEVLFVGTWMPERGSFLLELIKLGVPLTLRGSSWQRSPEWHELKKYWKPAVYGDDYAKAIQCAKISLGLLSKGNRDLHTTRSSEIPSLGGLLCSERTSEHSEMYEEGKEALFWSDSAECASICKLALADEDSRQAIIKAGLERVKRNGQFNEVMLIKIMMTVAKLDEV
jgi:hypothetical protein